MAIEGSMKVADAKRKDKRAAIASLHFSPAYASYMIAMGKLLRKLGFDVTFVIAKEYASLGNFSDIGDEIVAGALADMQRWPDFQVVVLCNSSVRNPSFASRMRSRGAAVFYVYHEPLSVWNWKQLRMEGWRQIVRFPFSTYFSIQTVRQSSGVIVPSSCARAQYERNYWKYNNNLHSMPLLFDDEISPRRKGEACNHRRLFGFVGSASRGHGFDKFVNFARFAIRSGSTIQFAIVTRRDLSKLLRSDNELSGYCDQGKILIEHGKVLSNREMNQYYADCFCVWNVYSRSTQSGVLPRSFMAGTPVMANRTGSFPEFVKSGVTGEFIDSAEDLPAMLNLAEKIRDRSSDYEDGCRKMFMETFYYGNNVEKFAGIIESASILAPRRNAPAQKG